MASSFQLVYLQISILLLLLLLLLQKGSSFISGAGGCNGQSSLESFHLSRTSIISGNLSDYNISLFFDGYELDHGSAYQILTGTDYLLTLSISEPLIFRGFLFRLAGPSEVDTFGMLTPTQNQSDSQEALQCSALNLGGVTHRSNAVKTEAQAILNIDQPIPMNYSLEVTVVVYNRAFNDSYSLSQYYWSDYFLMVISTFSPVFSPSPRPSSIPSLIPSPFTAISSQPTFLFTTLKPSLYSTNSLGPNSSLWPSSSSLSSVQNSLSPSVSTDLFPTFKSSEKPTSVFQSDAADVNWTFSPTVQVLIRPLLTPTKPFNTATSASLPNFCILPKIAILFCTFLLTINVPGTL